MFGKIKANAVVIAVYVSCGATGGIIGHVLGDVQRTVPAAYQGTAVEGAYKLMNYDWGPEMILALFLIASAGTLKDEITYRLGRKRQNSSS